MRIPNYLKGYEELYAVDPRSAALEWFRNARWGLMIPYGLYSLLEKGEWVLYNNRIPLLEYKKLKDSFTADRFDADAITDLALTAEMKYINLVSRFADSFCLFGSKVTDFNSVNSPANLDIVAELARVCHKKGLALFLYYSYALDWCHPYFPSRKSGIRHARPNYKKPEPTYLWREDKDTRYYIDFIHIQLRNILTEYGPIAGIWFDPVSMYYDRPDLFPVEETYALIRSLQPQCLISYKQGANGHEDFVAPEHRMQTHPVNTELSRIIWEKNKGRPGEICETLQPGFVAGYDKASNDKHRGKSWVTKILAEATSQKANLLLSTGLLGDGSIHPEDEKTLREVGKLIRKED